MDLSFLNQKEVTMVDISHIATKLKAIFSNIGMVRTFRGTGKNAGKFKLVVQLDVESDLHITIDGEQMLTNKKYFDGMMEDIHALRQKALARRQELCRTGY